MPRIDKIALEPSKLSRRAALMGLLRGEVGKEAGVSWATIGRAFSGKSIGVHTARRVAKALGVSIADIAAEEVGAT